MSLDLIRAWHRHELQQVYAHPSPCRLVMGTLCWGEPYTFDFSLYGLPSIIARENRDWLDSVGWSLVLYVDEASRTRLEPRCRSLGIPCEFRMIPGDVMAAVRENAQWKYPMLAAVHNVLIHEAGRINAGFHMLVSDVIYSHRYFANLLRLSGRHDAIPHTGFAAERTATLALLDNFRQHDGTLRIRPRDLGQIGWDHLVTPWRGWALPDDFDMMPQAHYMHARGQDSVHLHSAHQTAAWISPDRCRQVTAKLGGTIDSELPRYMGANPYATTLDDEMTFVALAGNCGPDPLVPFAQYREEFWRFIGNNRDFLPYFVQPCPVPLATVDPYQPTPEQLVARVGRLMQRLETP